MNLSDLVLRAAPGDGPDWPEAMIAVAGVAMITTIVGLAIWQVLASYRAKMSLTREEAYRKLAEDSVAANRSTGEGLREAVSKLAQLEQRTGELERMLKEVG